MLQKKAECDRNLLIQNDQVAFPQTKAEDAGRNGFLDRFNWPEEDEAAGTEIGLFGDYLANGASTLPTYQQITRHTVLLAASMADQSLTWMP